MEVCEVCKGPVRIGLRFCPGLSKCWKKGIAMQGHKPTVKNARTADVLFSVGKERERQEQLKALGKFSYTCADDGLLPTQKLSVLTEEVGEVAREINDHGGVTTKLREELIQVAAVAVAWAESLPEAP